MKDKIKTICLLIITISIIIIAFTLIILANKKPNTYDVNNDGVVSSVDYVLIKNYIMGVDNNEVLPD